MKLQNASQKSQRYYGLHMAEGVAEYREPKSDPYRIFVGEETIKNMDPTFTGCPIYVNHVDEVDLENIQNESDGWVVKSFFNEIDGKHWVEFMIVSDKGHQAIANGWKLSNAYIIKNSGSGGQWHGVDYVKEVKAAEYEHLALVQNPRYAESVILTPEKFKEYCGTKEIELKRLQNEKEPRMATPKFNFFKRTKVDNSADLETMTVTLPKSQREVEIAKLINDADQAAMGEGEPMMANGDHQVMVGEEKMKVNDLVAKHMAACNELAELKKGAPAPQLNAEDEAKKKAEDEAKNKKANEEKAAKDADDKKANEEKAAKEEEEKKKNSKFFNELENAGPVKNEQQVDILMDKVQRGKERYGARG